MNVERLPIDFKRQLLKWGITLPLMALGLFLLIVSYLNIAKYNAAKQRSVEVQATISDVEYRYDSETGDDYSTYIRYHHDGQEYRVFWKEFSTDPSGRIGQQVSIQIDPAEPGKLLSGYKLSIIFAGFFSHPLLAIACYTAFLNGRKTCIEIYGQQHEALAADRYQSARRRVYWLSCFVYGVSAIAHAVVLTIVYGKPDVQFLFGFAAFVGAAVLLRGYIKTCKALKT